MNKEMIMELLNSKTKDLDTIASNLKIWFQKDPSLALFTLHYAIEHEQYKDIFDILLTSVPELDSQDEQGNTLLHHAVRYKRIWAIKALVKSNRVDRNLLNKQNQSPLDLAQNNHDLFKAITCLDLERVPSFGRNSDIGDSLQRLKGTFPLLSNLGCNKSAISAHEENLFNRSRSESWQSFLKLSDTQIEQELEAWYIEKAAQQFKQMLDAYQDDLSKYPAMLKKFVAVCKQMDLSTHADIQVTMVRALAANQDIFDDLLSELATELQNKFSTIQAEQKNLMEDLLYLIINESLQLSPVPPQEPPFHEISPDEIELLKVLWSLTAGIDHRGTTRKINLENIIYVAFYLQNMNSLTQIIAGLHQLFPYFDHQQKLVANYIVWQLLTCNVNEHFLLDANFIEQLNRFTMCNKAEEGLGEVGSRLYRLLNALVRKCESSCHLPLFANYRSFRQIALQLTPSEARQSFDELFERALTLNRDQRTKELGLIARELRILSMEFYQKIILNEFAALNWNKEDPNLAANIYRQMARFNQMSNYFLVKVLNQPTAEKTVNTLQLLIQIAQALCPLIDGQLVDLHHLMIITSVLDNSAITRLKPYMATLTEQDQAIVEELNKIVDLGQNKYWQRTIQSSCKTLPYTGLFQTDLTFAKDGNPSIMGKAEACGNILLKIWAVKQSVHFNVLTPRTDLIEFIDRYIPVHEDILYETSLRKLPKETKVILNFDELEKKLYQSVDSFNWGNLEGCRMPPCGQEPKVLGEKLIGAWLLISELNYNYLDQYMIPKIKFKDKIYSLSQLGDKLIDFFMMQLNELNKPATNEIELSEKRVKQLFLLALSDKITSTIHRFIFIHNNYQSSKLSKRTIFSLVNKIKAMKEALAKKIETDIDLKSHYHSPINSIKRRSLSFFSSKKVVAVNLRSPSYGF